MRFSPNVNHNGFQKTLKMSPFEREKRSYSYLWRRHVLKPEKMNKIMVECDDNLEQELFQELPTMNAFENVFN